MRISGYVFLQDMLNIAGRCFIYQRPYSHTSENSTVLEILLAHAFYAWILFLLIFKYFNNTYWAFDNYIYTIINIAKF